ncbi:MAG: arabinosyltransferase C-terminal domain-containing protein [Segniliparus sp.]|uniref:arabinosyltransferase C-terminal domain-containing protein n=1 Tax=Segniliparus sp. TaxID=2804064 RepID=UPI003F410CA1
MQSSEGPTTAVGAKPGQTDRRSLIVFALALVSILCSLLVPFMPVTQRTASLAWGGQEWKTDGGNDVVAPLIALMPLDLHASIPCSAVAQLPPTGGVLLSTEPKDWAGSTGRGLFIQVFPDQVQVTSHGQLVASAPRQAGAAPQCQTIDVWATPAQVGASFVGLPPQTGAPQANAGQSVVSPHFRPEFSGVFTDLKGALDAPPSLVATADTRFDVTATAEKTLVVLLSAAALVAALALRWGPIRPRLRVPRIKALDLAVAGVLLVWNWLGAYSADDGYLVVMGRAARSTGYLANYYRYFGAAEAPFDWYDRVLSLAVGVTDQGVWLRLISVAAGLAVWALVSRVVLPKLGDAVAGHPLSSPTAAVVLIAFWLPFCSGLRPEALITLGAIATWCLAERAIAGGRAPFFAASAVLVAALTQALAPQGVVAVAVLLAATPAVLRSLRPFKLADLALIAASGLAALSVVFAQQTFAGVLEALRLRYAVDTTNSWAQEFLRWNSLLNYSPEGSIPRRWPLLAMLLCLGVVVFALSLRKIAGVRQASAWRLVAATFLTMLLLSLVPYKWPEHFGVFAAFGAVLAAAATALAAQYAKRSVFVSALVASAAFFFLALTVAGKNGWFWVQSFSIPSYYARPFLGGHALNSLLLLFFLLFGAVAGFLYLRRDYTSPKPGASRPDLGRPGWRKAAKLLVEGPVLWISLGLVLTELVGFAGAAASRYPAYSLALGNLRAVAGGCGLADSVLAEADPNAGFLRPADGADPKGALGADQSVGFTPTGLPEDVAALGDGSPPGIAHVNHSGSEPVPIDGQEAGTSAGYSQTTHTLVLPFGLAQDTPVLGSYGYNTGEAHLVSGWYELGPITGDTPLVVMSAAGHIASTYLDGTGIYGQNVAFEFGRREGGGFVVTGSVPPIDPGDPLTSYPWRNLRLPTSAIPSGSAFVRVVVNDHDLQPDQWVAVTPPRLPRLVTLQQLIGGADPVFLDFAVAEQFPCQRPFGIRDGVAELPKWRILPDHRLAGTASLSWLGDPGGGLLGVVEPLLDPTTTPTYFADDWRRDWGSVQRYALIPKGAVPAVVATDEAARWGWWRPGPSQALEP